MNQEQVRDQLELMQHLRDGELVRRLGPALAMADTIERYVYPPKLTLILPAAWYPSLVHFDRYDLIHADVDDAMVGVGGCRTS